MLVAFARGVNVADRGPKDAYWQTYKKSLCFASRIRQRRSRVRLPKGLMQRPMDSLVRQTVFALALDEVPYPKLSKGFSISPDSHGR